MHGILFLELVKRRVDDQYILKFYEDINASSMVNTYNLKIQPYLDILTLTKYRKAMSSLKMSSHRLQIEPGAGINQQASPYLKENVHYAIN